MNYQPQITSSGMLALDQIVTDDALQPRIAGLDPWHVQSLMQSDPTEWPAIRVREHGGNRYLLIDGFHRLKAAKELGLTALRADIGAFPGGIHDAFLLNQGHGKALSLDDRKAYARRLKTEQAGLSYNAIAKMCGLSDHTVKAAIEGQLQPLASANKDEAEQAGDDHTSTADLDPIERMIDLIAEADAAGTARGLFGDKSITHIKRCIALYEADYQPQLAREVHRWGVACVKAAQMLMK